MSPPVKYALLIILLLLLVSIPLAMQREAGTIEGLITNEIGPVAKASVEARNVVSGAFFRAESDVAGRYRLDHLPQGRYSLWVCAPAHDCVWIRQVPVDHDQTTYYDIRLGKSETTASPLPPGASLALAQTDQIENH
jgi:hypothetical protein